jgi:hypothetical protein
VPESELDGSMTITAISFERAPMGPASVLLYDFNISLGEAGGEELGSDFGKNLASGSSLEIVYSGTRVTAADDGEGRINFVLDTPYEYNGGNLLIDLSYTNIQGSVYVWSFNAGGNRFVVAADARAAAGTASSMVPTVVISGE